MNIELFAASTAKARRLIRWANLELENMASLGCAGEIDSMERSFFSVMALISSLHEAISAAAKHANMRQWRDNFSRSRQECELLFYLWKARDADIHDAVLKWRPSLQTLQWKIVDVDKYNLICLGFYQDKSKAKQSERLMMHLYGAKSIEDADARLWSGEIPSLEKYSSAGLKLDLTIHALFLGCFKCRIRGGFVEIQPPKSHLGIELNGTADHAAKVAIGHYESQLHDLCAAFEHNNQGL